MAHPLSERELDQLRASLARAYDQGFEPIALNTRAEQKAMRIFGRARAFPAIGRAFLAVALIDAEEGTNGLRALADSMAGER